MCVCECVGVCVGVCVRECVYVCVLCVCDEKLLEINLRPFKGSHIYALKEMINGSGFLPAFGFVS